jgi:hypothetical protein
MAVNFVKNIYSEVSLLNAIAMKQSICMEALYKRNASAVFAFAYLRIYVQYISDYSSSASTVSNLSNITAIDSRSDSIGSLGVALYLPLASPSGAIFWRP